MFYVIDVVVLEFTNYDFDERTLSSSLFLFTYLTIYIFKEFMSESNLFEYVYYLQRNS